MTSTPAIGSVCASHAECDAIAFAYCASASGGGAQFAGACMSCDDCALHADGIDGACPSTCATRTMTSGVGATGADEFFEDFGYWVKVRDGAAGVERVHGERERGDDDDDGEYERAHEFVLQGVYQARERSVVRRGRAHATVSVFGVHRRRRKRLLRRGLERHVRG